ncbi:MAG: TIGR03960 family B12-binding radical SAM protein, partial [Candidatus Cloacimonetes bacterium]|nr:TIGR03960 family B12-binding radical SAM protein [Candidatus Cloacimonadota bacterium]
MTSSFPKVDFEFLLPSVIKPSRYINHEINSFRKEPSRDTVNFCLAYPDVYEVGFSHLGLKILYYILNQHSDFMADRVYAPWPDCADLLRQHGLPLFGLESRMALSDFDVIGFTLQSELTYTNILYMLDLSGIPLYSRQRKNDAPLILAGGPNTSNPLPLSPFIDAFLIGDGEEAILEIGEVIKKNRKSSRQAKLKALQQIEGIFVPLLHDGATIRCRKIDGLQASKVYKRQLLPWTHPVHYRYVAEIMRGCSRGCRFCHAGFFYRPVREREPDEILQDMLDEIRKYGWQEAALSSLSSSDYSCIKPLLLELYRQMEPTRTTLSLPSLRVDSLDEEIIRLINALRQTGLTLAPEAGSQRLRDIINKNLRQEEIINSVKTAFSNGWTLIKLYFMIGLPQEEESDIDAMINLIHDIIAITQKKVNINITISPFVPKVFTPLQWAGMDTADNLRGKATRIKKTLQCYRFLKINYHDIASSQLECILGRGDTRVAELIRIAYEKGDIFTGWQEFFDFTIWENAARQCSLEFSDFLAARMPQAELPWDFIDIGVRKSFLQEEWKKAARGETTPDCREGECTGCGVCTMNISPHFAGEIHKKYSRRPEIITPHPQVHYFYRLFYHKTNALRFVGHLDMLRTLQTILRASELPLSYTQGFNIRPRLQFGPPLAVGLSGEREFLDFTLDERLEHGSVLIHLQRVFPAILPVVDLQFLGTDIKT